MKNKLFKIQPIFYFMNYSVRNLFAKKCCTKVSKEEKIEGGGEEEENWTF